MNMGIKLTKVGIIIFLLLVGCKSKRINSNYSQEEENYVIAYKKVVLYNCINQSTDKQFYNFLSQYNDLGLYTETVVLFHETADKASFLGKNYADKITPINYPDAENKLPIFRDCVSYAFSKEVDSVARASYIISTR